MKRKKQKYPFFANLFIKIFFPKDDNLYLSGDFKELYFHILETEGRFAAWHCFWWQILISVPHFISELIVWRMSMFKNYFKIAIWNLNKYKGHSFIK